MTISYYLLWYSLMGSSKKKKDKKILYIVIHRSKDVEAAQMSTKWIKKMWLIYIREYYLALKRRQSCHVLQHG